MLDLLLKDFGPIWLLGLFPLMFVMIGRGAWQIHRTASTPHELARFAGFPQRLADNPERCRTCSVVLFMGICLVALTLVGIPVWAVLHNELTNVERISNLHAAEKALRPLEICLMVTGFGGGILIFSAYLAAFLSRKQPIAHEAPETSLPLAESGPDGEDIGVREHGQVGLT